MNVYLKNIFLAFDKFEQMVKKKEEENQQDMMINIITVLKTQVFTIKLIISSTLTTKLWFENETLNNFMNYFLAHLLDYETN